MCAPVPCPRPTFPATSPAAENAGGMLRQAFFQGDDDSLNLMDSAEVADSKREFPGIWAQTFNEGNSFDFDNLIEAGECAILLALLKLNPSRKNLALFEERETDLSDEVRSEYLKACGRAA